ncbi:hypothetical protein ACLB2K_044873 [Fragaria x ananassa]
MAKNVIRGTISDTVRSCVVEPELAIDFMGAIRQKFKECSKAEGARLSRKLHELNFNSTGNIRTHLMQLEEINNKLRDLRMGSMMHHLIHEVNFQLWFHHTAPVTEKLQKVKCFSTKRLTISRRTDGFKKWMLKKGFVKQEGTSEA